MKKTPTVGEILQAKGVSRRGFLKYCATTASILASAVRYLAVIPGVHGLHGIADALGVAHRRGPDL